MLTLTNTSTRVRLIAQIDIRNILRMVNSAWRVYLGVPLLDLEVKLKAMPGFLVEDRVGLRGFMIIEPQDHNVALLIAAGLRDTWGVRPYLDLLLPEIERAIRAKDLSTLAYIGNAVWLIDELKHRGFETREWIVAFERSGVKQPPPPPTPAAIRIAHLKDLQALLALDLLAFGHLWRQSVSNLRWALVNAASFVLAEIEGQIVGYSWCEVDGRHAHLTRLAVHPNYQARGIGAQLLHRAITDVLAGGSNWITLNTQENNNRSRSLYRRFGFVDTGQRMPVLWKDLGP